MHDLHRLLGELASGTIHRAALVTLVARSGSSYRKPGARLLVTETTAVGAVSGGCLETSLHRIGREVIAQQRSRLVTIDTSREDDLLWGYGLGCPGVLQFLIEPIDGTAVPEWLAIIDDALQRRVRAVVVTEVAEKPRRLVLAGPDSSGDSTLHELATLGMTDGKSSLETLEDSRFFVEVVDPPLSLLIFGAGDDALPLPRLASELGWDTTVIDRRPGFARADRFPLAKRVIAAHVEEIDPALILSADAAVITTHHYETDRALLALLAPVNLRYIGIIGSPRRFAQLSEELGLADDPRIFGPAGLDLGAEGSTEIALSIVAQIRAVFAGRKGGALKARIAEEQTADIEGEALRVAACDLES